MRTQVAAGRYATALFAEAKETGNLVSVIGNLVSLVEFAEKSKDFGVFIKSPIIAKEDKAAVIKALGDKGMLDKFTCSFLILLANKNRLDILNEITDYLKRLAAEEKGEAVAEIVSAVKLGGDTVKELETVLSKITGKKITAATSVDGAVIGGFTAKVGSTLYDASIKGQINKLRDRLIS